MGNVLQAGVGQAPARQASIFAGLPTRVEAVTVNKVCASGLKAVVFAAQNVQMGLAEAEVAGGMESMSRVPYYVPRAAQFPTFGSFPLEDGLIKDGLWDVYEEFLMGNCVEQSVKQFGLSREEQDSYAIRSYKRAQKAWQDGAFDDEIAPVEVSQKSGQITIREDEGYKNLDEEKLTRLKPAFVKDGSGTVTAGNASTMNDGASAVVVVSRELASKYGRGSRVLSKIVAYADAAVDPVDYSIAPAKAIKLALARASLKISDIALWEVNEAFAAVIKVTEKLLGLDESARINMRGGAIALGHALGSSGARCLTTLLHQLEVGKYGVVALCNGGGASTAMVVQRVNEVT